MKLPTYKSDDVQLLLRDIEKYLTPHPKSGPPRIMNQGDGWRPAVYQTLWLYVLSQEPGYPNREDIQKTFRHGHALVLELQAWLEQVKPLAGLFLTGEAVNYTEYGLGHLRDQLSRYVPSGLGKGTPGRVHQRTEAPRNPSG
jgi:hypothetical protein